MMDHKNILVAASYDEEKKCTQVLKVITISEKEHNMLLNEEEEYKNKKRLEKENIKKSVLKCISKINKHDLLLAKSIYDNFVIRGYIKVNKEFDLAFYNSIVKDEKLDSNLYPEEFANILDKVVKQK